MPNAGLIPGGSEHGASRPGAPGAWGAVNRLCEIGCGICLILIASFTLYEIVCRYVFNSPTLWAQDFSVYLMIWCAFLGVMPTDRADQHIRIDIWFKRLSPRAQLLLDLIIYLCVAGFAAVAAWSGTQMVLQSLRFHRMSLSLISVPIWIPQFALVCGMGLFFLECVRRIVIAAIALKRPQR